MTTLMNGFVSTVKNIVTSLQVWQEQRTARTALMSMDDEQLRDIGLTRNEIDAAVRGDILRPNFQGKAVVATAANTNVQGELPLAA